ncbi:MAG: dihydroorotate dehydrogenase-like protein [Bacteroidales bacterium]|nr:dihydroorotate dehydrogenase-like protein [Bacteroidales bacterium]
MVVDISTKFAGLDLKSPIIVGSSGLTGSTKHFKEFEQNGAGAIVLKSLFEEEIVFEYNKVLEEAEKYGYDQENIDYFDLKIKQDNLNKYIQLIKDAKDQVSIPVIASINCVSTYEWIYFTKKIEEAGADALELNIFLLPSDAKKSSQEIEETYFEIIKKVKSEVKIPLIIKMSSYFTNLGQMIQKVSKSGINGLVLFNRFYSPDIDINSKHITASSVFSTPTDITIPLRWVAMSSGKVDCSLAASTGVHDGEGLIKMVLAGVDAVEIVSTLYKNGASQIKVMNDMLINYLKDQDLESISQIKGLVSQRSVTNPALFERVQFMKYFSDREDII